MTVDVPVNTTDMIVLAILGIMFLGGIRVVIGFFKKPAAPKEPQKLDGFCNAGERITVSIDGMMCGMCELHVKDAIRKAFPDAKDVTASHESGKARFTLTRTEELRHVVDSLHATIDPQGYKILEVVNS